MLATWFSLAKSTLVASPDPGVLSPSTITPTGFERAQIHLGMSCSASILTSSRALGVSCASSNAGTLAKAARRVCPISSLSSSFASESAFAFPKVSSPTFIPKSRSVKRAFSFRFLFTSSIWERKSSPRLPPISVAWARTPASPSYLFIQAAAVFSPTPGTPGRLSAFSPTKAAISG